MYKNMLITLAMFLNPLFAQSDFHDESALIFSGNANYPLAKEVASYLQTSLGEARIGRFKDGEIAIHLDTNVRNKDIFVIQPTCPSFSQSVNDSIMELYLLIRTIKRASAKSITAVLPYYGYARQDRKAEGRVPISAADMALLLESAGADRVVTIDLHCGQIQGFFRDIPVDNLYASNVFLDYFLKKHLEHVVVVSPDAGGVYRAKKFQDQLTQHNIIADIAMITKQRASAGVISSMSLIGNVENADAIIIDDLCDSGGTLVRAVELLKEKGAHRVFAVVTHPVFSGEAIERIQNSPLYEMVVTDTIPLRTKTSSNIVCLSVGELLGEAIYRIQHGESISNLFP